MKLFFSGLSIVLFLFFSCSSAPSHKPEAVNPAITPETPEIPENARTSASAAVPKAPPPAIPERPVPPEHIMGKGMVSQEKLMGFLQWNNATLDPAYVRALAAYYIEEAAIEGVNHDVAFAQMCHETGYLRYGNLVSFDMNNFAGLGSTGLPGPDGQPERGLYFPSPRIGVRAHIQHLKAYGSTEPLNQELVNPRFRFVQRGRAPTIHGLTGTWATDPAYSQKISTILQRLYQFSFF
ncbi:MAG: glucosaminidase domain-containing protein [Treponema sp.]|nr:glucosaminidase domain-containing protein [Treponema sp.]